MAAADAQQLQALIADVQTSTPSIQEMLDELLGLQGRAAADAADRETLLDQAVQLRPAREYIVVMCESEGEWAHLVTAFDLKASRRGGYKRGSPYDDIGTNRVIYASELLSRLNADSDTE